MVQYDDVPIDVEDGRAGRSSHCVGGIPEHVIGALEQLVLAGAELLAFAAGVLHDGEPFAVGYLAGTAHQRESTELLQPSIPGGGNIPYSDHGEV